MNLILKLTLRAGLVALGAAAAGSALAQAPSPPSQYPDLATGEAVYKQICQGCHMPDGKGAAGAGAYPALASNAKLGVAAYPFLVLLRGQKAMPEFGSALTDAQIADVVGYIRTNFGNAYKGPVTAADVAQLRPPK